MLESRRLMKLPPALALALLVSAPAAAQEPAPVYQAPKQHNFELKVDGLVRREWTEDIFRDPGLFESDRRWRFRLLPRLEIGAGKALFGVGGDFNYGSDKNTEPAPALLRDNYDSRDARLDLAFATLKPVGWLQLQAGRFAMPVALTEMIWDRDLRPQGGAVTLEAREAGAFKSVGVTALGARGSHVFKDEKTDMVLFSGQATFASETASHLQVMGSYVKFGRIDDLEPMIRRQNTRVAGEFVKSYEIVDLVGRFHYEGKTNLELVGDYCWNRAADADNKGLWLGLVLGSTTMAKTRVEYTYAKVDKDATLAAYATDDFFWSTGWEGHRADVGVKSGERGSLHAIGQLQRFKDSPRPEEREHWVKRLRLEVRFTGR